MKLLVKSDDYGFTKGVTDGVCDALKFGILTSTGLFTSVPNVKYAVKRMEEFPDFCFGIDINVVSGPSILSREEIPALVDENGEFIRSTVKYADPRFVKGGLNAELWPYEECFKEACAQIDRYIELVGRKPAYVTGHSISNAAPEYARAIRDAAIVKGIPFAGDLLKAFNVVRLPSLNVKPFTMEAQLNADVESYTLKMLEEHKDLEYAMIGGHCGYVDDELLKYTTYTIIRAKDHVMYTSSRIKQWIEDNNVELISFSDLVKDLEERK